MTEAWVITPEVFCIANGLSNVLAFHNHALRDGRTPSSRTVGTDAEVILTRCKAVGRNLDIGKVHVLSFHNRNGLAMTEAWVITPEVFCIANGLSNVLAFHNHALRDGRAEGRFWLSFFVSGGVCTDADEMFARSKPRGGHIENQCTIGTEGCIDGGGIA